MPVSIRRATLAVMAAIGLAACQPETAGGGPDAAKAQPAAPGATAAAPAGKRPYAPAGKNGATVTIRPEGDVIIAAVGGEPISRDGRGTLITASASGDEFDSLILPPGSHDLTLGMLGSMADMVDVSIDAKPGNYTFTVLEAGSGRQRARILAVIEGGPDGVIVASSEPVLAGRTRAEALALITATPAERNRMLGGDAATSGGEVERAASLYEKGRQYLEQNQLELALASFDDAIALVPDLEPAHTLRGILLLQLERPGEAVEAFDRSLEIGTRQRGTDSESLAGPYFYRAAALSVMGRPEEAVASLDRSLALKPTPASYNARARMYFSRGEELQARGELAEARASFEKALADAGAGIALMPNNAALWSMTSRAQFMLQRAGPGCEAARKACTLGNCSIVEARPECKAGS